MISRRLDYTLLKPEATYSDVASLCVKAAEHNYYAVCIPPCYTNLAVEELTGSGVVLATVVDYPFGFAPTEVKLFAAQQQMIDGVEELDVVLNISRLKSGNLEYLSAEIAALRALTAENKVVLKTIIEAGLLSEDELTQVCELCAKHEVDFVKNSSGVRGGDATPDLIRNIRTLLPEHIKIKASGGIRTSEQAAALLDAGADRLGSSTALNDIVWSATS